MEKDSNTERKNVTKPMKKTQSKWNDYPGKNLRFLLEFKAALGLNTESLCKPTGLSPQSIRIQFKRDDMKLSKAKRIIESHGYKLNVNLTPRKQGKDNGDNYIVNLPVITKKTEQAKNLDFLKDFMQLMGESQYALANKLEVTQGAVFAWLSTDDILISYLVKIVEKYDADIEFKITE